MQLRRIGDLRSIGCEWDGHNIPSFVLGRRVSTGNGRDKAKADDDGKGEGRSTRAMYLARGAWLVAAAA